MTGRQIRRLLYGLLMLALFVIVLHSGRSVYLLAKDGHDQSYLKPSEVQYYDYSIEQVRLDYKLTINTILNFYNG